MSAVVEGGRVRFAYPTLRKEREGWGTRRWVTGIGSGFGTKGCDGTSPIVFGPRTLVQTRGTPVDLSARNGLVGEARGIPHLAKNERDVGHPAIVAGIESEKRVRRKVMQRVVALTW